MIAVHKKNSDMWVKRDTLKNYAFNVGYSNQTVWDAFKKLDNTIRIGKIFDNGARYIYYDIPEKEVKQMEQAIKEFDKLP